MAGLTLNGLKSIAQCGKNVVVSDVSGDVYLIDISSGLARRVQIDVGKDAAKDQRPVGDGVSKDPAPSDPSEPF